MENDFRRTEISWLEEHREELYKEHPGQWVGIDSEGLIASATNLMDLMEICSIEGRDPLVLGIPEADEPTRFYGGATL